MSKVSRGDLGLLLGALALFVSLGGTSVAKDVGAQASALLTGKKLRSGTITAREIKSGGVGSSEIADGSVRAVDLGAAAVLAGKIAPGAVGSAQLAPGSVGSGQITDGLSNTIAISEGEVGSTQLADGSVRTVDVGVGQIGSEQLGDGSVRFVDIGADSVGGDQVRNGSIGFGDLTDGTSNTILFGEVDADRIPDGTVTNEQIDEGTLPFIEEGHVKAAGTQQSAGQATTSTFEPILARDVTVSVPSKAIVTTTFTAEDVAGGGYGRVEYRLTREGTDLNAGAAPQALDLHLEGDAQTGAATAVVSLLPGTHTFHVEARHLTAPAELRRRSVSVLVLPG